VAGLSSGEAHQRARETQCISRRTADRLLVAARKELIAAWDNDKASQTSFDLLLFRSPNDLLEFPKMRKGYRIWSLIILVQLAQYATFAGPSERKIASNDDNEIVSKQQIATTVMSIQLTDLLQSNPCLIRKSEGEYYQDTALALSPGFSEELDRLQGSIIHRLSSRNTTRRELNATAYALATLISKSAVCKRVQDLPPDTMGYGGPDEPGKAVVKLFTPSSLKAYLAKICPLFPICD